MHTQKNCSCENSDADQLLMALYFFAKKNFFFLPKTLIGIDLKMCEVRKVNHSLAQAIRIILVIKASSNERLFAFTMIYSMDCWLLECVSSKNYEEVAKSTF